MEVMPKNLFQEVELWHQVFTYSFEKKPLISGSFRPHFCIMTGIKRLSSCHVRSFHVTEWKRAYVSMVSVGVGGADVSPLMRCREQLFSQRQAAPCQKLRC